MSPFLDQGLSRLVCRMGFAGNDEFTYNLGVGYRLMLADWLSLHFDARDHIFETDLLGELKTTNNLELHGGLTIFF